ncbi:MAG: heavy-metal-associated domain-containing protein [Flavobacteriales bacterium]|jgi:mercuric ion binding protein
MKHISILILGLFISLTSFSQESKKPVSITFRVEGICGMCEKSIESALDAKGIVAADYNLDTNIATVTYKPSKISEEQIHKLVTARGYDTDTYKASEEEYSKTHDCCKYREQEKH